MANSALWDFYAKIYNTVIQLVDKQRYEIFSELALKESCKIYLAGCGTGKDLSFLPNDSQIYALDFSPEMLRRCKQQSAQLKKSGRTLNIQFIHGDAASSTLADNSVDVVILHLILAVVPDANAVMKEALRVLRPGGIISIWDKFVPSQKKLSLLRRGINLMSRPLATRIDLQIDSLLHGYPLTIKHRRSLFYAQMEHVIVEKQ